MRWPPRTLAALLGACLLSATSAASAQTLDEADAAFASGEIGVAASAYAAVLESGELSGEALQRAYVRSGLLSLWTGDQASARATILLALLANPELATPSELSPDQRAWFEAVRAELPDGPPIAIEASAPAGPLVVLTQTGAVEGLEVRVTFEHSPVRVLVAASPRVSIDVPPAAFGERDRARVHVALLDASDNAVRTLEHTVERPRSLPVVTPDADPNASILAPPEAEDSVARDSGDDVGLWVGIGLLVAVVLGAAAGAIGWAVWDSSPYETFFVVE